MKIISWNVAGLRACIKKGCLDFIRKEGADVYCFQEVKSEDVPFIEGYEVHNFPAKKKGYSGVLVYIKTGKDAFSKFEKPHDKISVEKGIGIDEFDNEARVITVDFSDFYLINVYFPHSSRDLSRLNFKLRFNKTFADYCKNLEKKKPLIIAGDFNVAHDEIDLANPKQNMKNAGFTPGERFWFTDFLKSGLVDTFRIFTQGNGHYTWWSYRFNVRARNIGWRVDYFLVSEKLRSKVKNSRILKDVMGSDHCPIELEIA
ncbi:MAG: exodeoxyribonuclease III [archaeon]